MVDDELALREVLCAFLDEEGFDTRGAGDGREALQILEGFHPAAIILDLMMPVMNGWELLDALDARAGLKNVPRVVLTAAPPDPAIRGRVASVFEKPFDIDALTDVLFRAVGAPAPGA